MSRPRCVRQSHDIAIRRAGNGSWTKGRWSDLDRRRHRHVIRRPFPTARVLGDIDARDAVAELRRDPDMIEAAAAIRSLPVVHRAIAPPCIELLGLRGEL